MLTENIKTLEKVSGDFRIDLIRKFRNALAVHFLEEQTLQVYFNDHFKSKLNSTRVEFIKMELHELLHSSVDLVHYATLLIEMKQAGIASLTNKNENLFYDELDLIFRKYAH